MRKILGYMQGMFLILIAHLIEFELGGKMDRDARRWFRWWLVAAMIIVVARLLSGCYKAPVVTVAKPDGTQVARLVHDTVMVHDTIVGFMPTIFELEEVNDNDGQVDCSLNNVPYISIRREFFPDSMVLARRLLLLHEEVHVRQAIVYGNCAAWVKKIHDSGLYNFQIEAEAYCFVVSLEKKEGLPHSRGDVRKLA